MVRTARKRASRTPHGEDRAQARVSNHGPLAPLSPAARPSAFALRATADKLRRRCAPPQDQVERVGIADLMVRSAHLEYLMVDRLQADCLVLRTVEVTLKRIPP
jgi:hypothetical protein